MQDTHAAKVGNYQLLQAVRCLAATVVVWHHTFVSPAFGNFGVDLFFVLSGCIMAMLMEPGPAPGDFLLRRVARVFPLYALVTTVLFLAARAVPSLRSTGITAGPGELVGSLLFVPYENSRGELFPILSAGWTLNFEMLFYGCCAVALCFRKQPAWIVSGLLVGAVSLAASAFPAFAPARFYADPIVLEFCGGMIVWRLWSAGGRQDAAASAPWAPLGLCCLLALPFLEQAIASGDMGPGRETWSRPAFLLPAAMVVIYAALACESRHGAGQGRVIRLLAAVGDASYAIYLTHLFTLPAIMRHVCPLLGLPPRTIATGIVATFIAIGVGVVVYRLVDKPMHDFLRKRLPPARVA